jgi:hypothetical protein
MRPGKEIIFKENELINEWKFKNRDSLQSIKSDIRRSARTRSFEHCRQLAMILTIASNEFLCDLESRPKMFITKPGTLVVENTGGDLTFTIPDWAALKAIDWTENVFMIYFDRAYCYATAAKGLFAKIQKLMEDRKWIARTELADLTRKHGRYLDEFVNELGLISVEKKREGGGPPTTYYMMPGA